MCARAQAHKYTHKHLKIKIGIKNMRFSEINSLSIFILYLSGGVSKAKVDRGRALILSTTFL